MADRAHTSCIPVWSKVAPSQTGCEHLFGDRDNMWKVTRSKKVKVAEKPERKEKSPSEIFPKWQPA
jgi:hypothetical protein